METFTDLPLGKKIRARRRQLDITQADLAIQVGVTQAAIASYECGSRHVSVEMLCRIAKILSVKPGEFLE